VADGHSGIEKIHVGIVVMVGISECSPDGECVGLMLRAGSLPRSQVPEKSLAAGESTGASATELALAMGEEEFHVWVVLEKLKVLFFRNKASAVEPEVLAQDGAELPYLGTVSGDIARETTGYGLAKHALHLWLQPFLGRTTVKRVVYLLPAHGKIAATAEITVAEHLRSEVAELDVEA